MLNEGSIGKRQARLFLMAAAIALLVFVCAFIDADKAKGADDTVTVSITGTYQQSEARHMLEWINNFRTGKYTDGNQNTVWARDESNNIDTESYKGLGTLQYDYELEKVAMQRALETALQKGHTRPNGTGCSTEIPEGYDSTGENLAYSWGLSPHDYTDEDAFKGLAETNDNYAGQGHRRNMLNRNFNRVGIAHVVIHWSGLLDEGDRPYTTKTDIHCWVQVFGKRTDNFGLTQTPAVDGNQTKQVEILKNKIEKMDITLENDEVTVTYGSTSEIEGAQTGLRLTTTWPEKFYLSWTDGASTVGTYLPRINDTYNLSSNNTDIATVSGMKVSGRKVGTGTLALVSKTDSSVSKSIKITVKPASIEDANVSINNANYTFTGSPFTPAPTVILGGKILEKDVDYTVSYSNNTNAGKAVVTIKGIGNYTGTATGSFDINPLNINDSDISISEIDPVVYTGSKHMPDVNIMHSGKILKKGTDYHVSYENNVNAGTATARIKGTGNYTGTAEASYVINPKTLSDNEITPTQIADMTYDGKEINPVIKVRSGGRTLTKDIDYSVAYANNIGPGKASVIITGKGNFTGTLTRSFNIVKPTPKDNMSDSAKDKEEAIVNPTPNNNLSDKDKEEAIVNPAPNNNMSDKDKEEAIVNPTQNDNSSDKDKETAAEINDYAKKNNIDPATLKLNDKSIGALKNDDGIKGAKFSLLRPYVKSRTKNAITIKWSKVKGASGYIIYGNKCNTKGKKYKFKKLKTITKAGITKWTQKKLKKGTYYKYIVLAYRNISGQKVTIAGGPTLHAVTKGGKFCVAKSVNIIKVGSKKKATRINLKKGKAAKIQAKEIKESKKLKLSKHRGLCYETTNAKVAKVTKKGVIKAVKKGKCKIYVYAQNGVSKAITVTVK